MQGTPSDEPQRVKHRRRPLGLAMVLCGVTVLPAPSLALEPSDVFSSFTGHIRRQIQTDKQSFIRADRCVQWFYGLQRKKPAPPAAQGVSFRRDPRPVQDFDCQTEYPGGLEAARADFSRTQSSLALSLTFYEYALVGDANDDGRYSTAELRDMLESFGLAYRRADAPAMQSALLEDKFDALRRTGELDVLMGSMGILYDKGYRFTSLDRAALNKVSG